MKMEIDFEKDEEVLEAALNEWGHELQVIVAIEELSELTQKLSKYLRHGRAVSEEFEDSVTQEIADVQVMLWQLSMIFPRRKVECWIEYKLQRLANRIRLNKPDQN